MEGATFDVQYLGNTMLPKATTGLGAVQKPLKDLYLLFRKPGGEKTAKDMTLIVQRNGLVFEFADPSGRDGKQAFYDIGLIHYIAALRFSATRGSDKKFKAAFLPIEDSKVPSNDKVYFQLDKKHANLVQSNHPPLLSLVMRRPTGVKSIECHSFVVRSSSDAIRLVSLVESLQTHGDVDYASDMQRERQYAAAGGADVIRTEFGEYEVYRGRKQLALTDEYFRPKDQFSSPTSPSEQGPPPTTYGDVHRQPPSAYVDSQMQHSPGYVEAQRHPSTGYGDPERQQQPPYSQANRQSAEMRTVQVDPYSAYPNNIENRRSAEISQEVEIRQPHVEQQDNRTSGDLRNEKWKMPRVGLGVQRKSGEASYDRNVVQPNQRFSGGDEYPDVRSRPNSERDYPDYPDQRGRLSGGRVEYGDYQSRPDGGRAGFSDKEVSNHDEAYKDHMIQEQQRRIEEERRQNELEDMRYTQIKAAEQNTEPPQEIRKREAKVKPLSPVANDKRLSQGPTSPVQQLSPRVEQPTSPRGEFPTRGPGYSASNLESRPEDGRQRPIAKVPPHLVAGIKVLPTAGVLKKPTGPREAYIKDNDYDNNVGVLKKQREMAQNYQKGGDYSDQHERYREHNPRDGSRPMSDPDPYQGQNPYFKEHPNRYSADDRLMPEPGAPYQFSEQDSRVNPQFAHENKYGAEGDPHPNVRKKEQEIASMFSNVKVTDPQFYTSGDYRH